MAFEQRAAVVKNLEDFVWCHREDVKSKVQSSKFKVGRGGALRQVGVHALACRRNKLKLDLNTSFCWLPNLEF
jgi:hypothetical protein